MMPLSLHTPSCRPGTMGRTTVVAGGSRDGLVAGALLSRRPHTRARARAGHLAIGLLVNID